MVCNNLTIDTSAFSNKDARVNDIRIADSGICFYSNYNKIAAKLINGSLRAVTPILDYNLEKAVRICLKAPEDMVGGELILYNYEYYWVRCACPLFITLIDCNTFKEEIYWLTDDEKPIKVFELDFDAEKLNHKEIVEKLSEYMN